MNQFCDLNFTVFLHHLVRNRTTFHSPWSLSIQLLASGGRRLEPGNSGMIARIFPSWGGGGGEEASFLMDGTQVFFWPFCLWGYWEFVCGSLGGHIPTPPPVAMPLPGNRTFELVFNQFFLASFLSFITVIKTIFCLTYARHSVCLKHCKQISIGLMLVLCLGIFLKFQ